MNNSKYSKHSPDNRRLKVIKKANGSKLFVYNRQRIRNQDDQPGYITWKNIIDIIQDINAMSGENFNRDEATALLKGAGIIDDSGELAALYR